MSNKRQRTTTSIGSIHITDLPDGILVGVSSYLAKPSAALFAITMVADSQQTETETSKAIISSTNWDTLDFDDIEKSLAVKLSDDDIDKILRCIDAINNVQILKLAGCVNITGSGLDILRSSVAIQQIDLSLVGKHEVPWIARPEPMISEDVVIPILDVIISRGRGSSMKQLDLPKKWKWRQSTQLHEFLDRYNDYLAIQRYGCSKCDRSCSASDDWISRDRECMEERECDWYGTQNYTCSQCVQHFCYRGDCRDENGACSTWCKKCEKEYCKGCVAMTECDVCNDSVCNNCEEMKSCGGEDCGEVLCEECYEEKTCSWCNKTRCEQCVYSITCKSDDCPNTICRDCEMDFDLRTHGYCLQHRI